MTALTVAVQRDRVHLIADGAAYDAVCGYVGLVQKVSLAPHLGLAMGFRGCTGTMRLAEALLMNMPADVDVGKHLADCLRLHFGDAGEQFDVVIAGMRGRKPFALLVSSHDRPEHDPFEPLDIPVAWSSPPVAPDVMDRFLRGVAALPTAAARDLLEAQRLADDCPVGGFGQLVTITATGMETKLAARWALPS